MSCRSSRRTSARWSSSTAAVSQPPTSMTSTAALSTATTASSASSSSTRRTSLSATKSACCRRPWTPSSTTAAAAVAVTGAEQPPAQVPVRHAQGQAGPLPPEPARQARRLFRPFGYRRRPGAEALSVRLAEGDGALSCSSPFVMKKSRRGQVSPTTSRAPSKKVEQGRAEVWDALENVIKDHPVHAKPRPDAAPPRHSGL